MTDNILTSDQNAAVITEQRLEWAASRARLVLQRDAALAVNPTEDTASVDQQIAALTVAINHATTQLGLLTDD